MEYIELKNIIHSKMKIKDFESKANMPKGKFKTYAMSIIRSINKINIFLKIVGKKLIIIDCEQND